ncbi:hypothetical protein HDU76_000458, partial [Blyttiomyces sp. JEL0837]
LNIVASHNTKNVTPTLLRELFGALTAMLLRIASRASAYNSVPEVAHLKEQTLLCMLSCVTRRALFDFPLEWVAIATNFFAAGLHDVNQKVRDICKFAMEVRKDTAFGYIPPLAFKPNSDWLNESDVNREQNGSQFNEAARFLSNMEQHMNHAGNKRKAAHDLLSDVPLPPVKVNRHDMLASSIAEKVAPPAHTVDLIMKPSSSSAVGKIEPPKPTTPTPSQVSVSKAGENDGISTQASAHSNTAKTTPGTSMEKTNKVTSTPSSTKAEPDLKSVKSNNTSPGVSLESKPAVKEQPPVPSSSSLKIHYQAMDGDEELPDIVLDEDEEDEDE